MYEVRGWEMGVGWFLVWTWLRFVVEASYILYVP